MPLLSICIPTYNREKYLEYCISNIKELDKYLIDYEVVFSDNASTDNTKEIILNHQKYDKRIKYFRNKETFSAFVNYSLAFRRSSGKLCCYLADDDKFIPSILANHVTTLQKEKQFVAIYTPFIEYDDVEQKILSVHSNFEGIQKFSLKTHLMQIVNLIVFGSFYPEICIAKRDAYVRSMLDNPQEILFNNFFFSFIKMLEIGDIILDPNPYYLSICKSKFSNNMSVERLYGKILDKSPYADRIALEWFVGYVLGSLDQTQIDKNLIYNIKEAIFLRSNQRQQYLANRKAAAQECQIAIQAFQRSFFGRTCAPQEIQMSNQLVIWSEMESILQIANFLNVDNIYFVNFPDESIKNAIQQINQEITTYLITADFDISAVDVNSLFVLANDSILDKFKSSIIPKSNIVSMQELYHKNKLRLF